MPSLEAPTGGAYLGPRVRVRGAVFGYGTDSPIVDDWSAEFHPGTVTAITGPSGCGKSTRLYLLGLMVKLTAGAVEIDGQRVDHLSDAARSRIRAWRFGFVFQDAALDPTRSVLDNIIEASLYRNQSRREAAQRARELMDRFDIAIPPDRRPGQISGGQAQRIALCRALLGEPDILVADEATGNLDPRSAATVLEAFREHAVTGGCAIVVTHDPTVAGWADRRISLDPLHEGVSA
ncbi:ATP-binding cassette domain-containing protein [Phycicoccus endophyticus]|nr:ATP-binding cassette domain-containing protein [Phycicoccus endophyticus]